MSGRPNITPAGEQDTRNEESLDAPVACDRGPTACHDTQTAAAGSNSAHPPAPALIGLVRLLARQAARAEFEALLRPEYDGGEFE